MEGKYIPLGYMGSVLTVDCGAAFWSIEPCKPSAWESDHRSAGAAAPRQAGLTLLSSHNVAHKTDMMQTDNETAASTLRRFWSRSLLVMMCVTSVSFRPWAMAMGPSVAYSVTTAKFKTTLVQKVSHCMQTHWSMSLTWEVVHEAS